MFIFNGFVLIAACVAGTVAVPSKAAATGGLPTVDLGYAVHQATVNDSGNGYYNFSNIRYAAPPLGNLRFAAPIPPQTSNRTINDGQQSTICPQANPEWELTQIEFLSGTPLSTLLNQTSSAKNLSIDSIPKPDPRTSEDCLFLDVIVPKPIFSARNDTKGKRATDGSCKKNGAPVLVWVYGGGYTSGNKAESGNPASLIASAEDNGGSGVIFVAMNYRIGLFGFLAGPTFQENGTANAGLLDQRLALEWVKKNIHLFGGDPDRVTVLGESAGGGSIMHQITAYGGLKGRAPFQQAIAQSPGFLPLHSNSQMEATYQQTLTYASLISQKSITSTNDLRNLSTTELYYTNYAAVGLAPYGAFTFGPVVDGSFAPKLPGELLLHGQFDTSLKVMLGHNLNEGLFFSSPFITNNTAFAAYIASTFPSASPAVISYITQTLYPPIFDGSLGYTTQLQRTALLVSEVSFTCNTRYLDLAYSNKTYSYYFTVPPGLHGEDVSYTFFNGDTTTKDDGGLPVNATIASALQHYITSFAMHGQPNEVGDGAPFFPIYGTNSSTEVLGIEGFGGQVKDTVANGRCSWWQKALYY